MANLIVRFRKLAKYMLPYGLSTLPDILRARSARAAERALLGRFEVNGALRGRHAGKRCFILCTGPSVKTQNLRRLTGELVISVSNAYLHPDFETFSPAYHCVPHMTFGAFTGADALQWLREMDGRLGRAELFLSDEQRDLVMEHGLLMRRPVHYLCMQGDVPAQIPGALPDLTARIPRPQSVPVMALMVALYMGCKDIYLLGTDHDYFLTGKYTYFFDKSLTSEKDPSVGEGGRVLAPRYDQFHELTSLWRQYRWLKECCAGSGVTIYNATAGGALDEFERVDFAALRLAGDSHASAMAI